MSEEVDIRREDRLGSFPMFGKPDRLARKAELAEKNFSWFANRIIELEDELGRNAKLKAPIASPSLIHYVGTCDVCASRIYMDHDDRDGIIDKFVDGNGNLGTWIRHLGGPFADCETYSSRVWAVDVSGCGTP